MQVADALVVRNGGAHMNCRALEAAVIHMREKLL